jgi:predicted house-cleaning noncanonical NTP pyrophosphatase (MazG superfamily)
MGKLVRDKIPMLIENSGEKPIVRILEEEEYRRCLEAKLDEEVAEFHSDRNAEELADILEVVYALAETIGCTKDALLQCYERKHAQRGGFCDRVFLEGKE